MHFQEATSTGPGMASTTPMDIDKPAKNFIPKSSSLPFSQHVPLNSINGPTYLTAQTLVQQVAYTLSDKIFTYSPETFDLDVALKHWQENGEKNPNGHTPGIHVMETRTGAGTIALGYAFSPDFDLKKRHIPQSIIASSATLAPLRPALDQLSLLYNLASPIVAHVAAVDYTSNGLVSDYISALSIADDLGLGLVASVYAHEAQHMSLFSTVLASVIPTIHTYDGVNVGRETLKIDALDQSTLEAKYNTILKSVMNIETKHSDNEGRVVRLMKAFNQELRTGYKLFEYQGHKNPKHVLVVFGTAEASIAAVIARKLAKHRMKVGVVNVRVYRPFVEEEFLQSLPSSVQSVAVLGQVEDAVAMEDAAFSSRLFQDVLAALNFSSRAGCSAVDFKYSRGHVWTPNTMYDIFLRLIEGESAERVAGLDMLDTSAQQFTFWSQTESDSVTAPIVLGQLLSETSSAHVTVRTSYDNLTQGGLVRTDIRSSKSSLEASYAVEAADLAFVSGEKLLGEFDILYSVKESGTLVVILPAVGEEELEKKLPVGFYQSLNAKNIRLFVLDTASAPTVNSDLTLESLFIQLAFLKLTGFIGSSTVTQALALINGRKKDIETLSKEIEAALRAVDLSKSLATTEAEFEKAALPKDVKVNNFSVVDLVDPEPPNTLENWVTAAKGLMFKEAFGTKVALRPDVVVKTAVVTVKEHRRLTPLTYDRNIFHVEFDLGNSGLTYAIGEALGIHAENDKDEVEQFIKWYGLDPDEIVQLPSRDEPAVLENRTVYQSLVQNVDIFGRPPKKFYEALAEFAEDEKEKQSLLNLGTPGGAAEFKRRAEVDTVTFADILLEFPSAHPSFYDLARIVSPMKRREYSIASSQNVTPTSVALLIVTVDWVDPKGRTRFGQATRYLNSLPIGASVTVSVKPSVMKLPPVTTAPIIMAGLGTGLAPFRAFVQERAYQKQKGQEIGAVMLYMGSRTQKEEYLYGEEWEAYQDAGIITLLGRAFSRDQPQKIYIQDRMRQTMDEVRQAYFKDEGSFYLCGPTWPVPDVTEVLQEAFETEEKSKGVVKKIDSRRAIEELKEDGRYVLEVY